MYVTLIKVTIIKVQPSREIYNKFVIKSIVKSRNKLQNFVKEHIFKESCFRTLSLDNYNLFFCF